MDPGGPKTYGSGSETLRVKFFQNLTCQIGSGTTIPDPEPQHY
jgi:hypothetical protein